MADTLRIVYKIENGIDSDLDDALQTTLEVAGWHRWASGCDLTTGERDLAFDRDALDAEHDDAATVETKLTPKEEK